MGQADLQQATITEIVDEIERRNAVAEVMLALQRRSSKRRTEWLQEMEKKGLPTP